MGEWWCNWNPGREGFGEIMPSLISAKDWRQRRRGWQRMILVGWHYQVNGHELGQTPGDGEGQGSLACYSPWGCRVRHDLTTEQQCQACFWRCWVEVLVDIQVVPCGMREVRNTGVHLWNWVRVEIELSHYCSGCSQSHRERERGGGDWDGWVRKMRGQERKKEQKQTQKLQSRPSNSIQSNVMMYHQHFLRTVALFSSSSILSITTFSNIPMFFIYIPSVSQIFEAT